MPLPIISQLNFTSHAVWYEEKKGFFNTTLSPENNIAFSCPPELGGDNQASPEDLFLASIATCMLTTILHLCDSLHTKPESLSVNVSANMVRTDNDYSFTDLFVIIEAAGEEFLLRRAAELAPKYCLIAKSVKLDIKYKSNITSSPHL